MYFLNKSKLLSIVIASSLLTACGSDNDNEPQPSATATPMAAVEMTSYTYEVSVTNLTNAQPMSPVAVVLHNEGMLWQLGQPASKSLEMLAESGDNSSILAENLVMASGSGTGALKPGATETITVSIDDAMPMKLSLATMLVNTNDAFTGINAMAIHSLAVGESISLKTRSYDAGTEMNSEEMSTIPGPAAGGEGYNSARDDVDFVAMHNGVVSVDDGLMTSVLTQAHRFDNPTLSIQVTRVE